MKTKQLRIALAAVALACAAPAAFGAEALS